MSLIRGVLLAGQFRSQRDLNTMSHDDQRNTLIVVIAGRTKETNLQSFNDSDLAGIGAVLVFLRTARIRSDADLKGLTADDMRNILIVELVQCGDSLPIAAIFPAVTQSEQLRLVQYVSCHRICRTTVPHRSARRLRGRNEHAEPKTKSRLLSADFADYEPTFDLGR